MFSLTGKVALITGGASGIGRAVAERYIEAGAIVCTGDVKPSDLAGLDEHYELDVSDEGNVYEVMSAVAKRHGNIQILVNNAGIVADENWFRIAEGTKENLEKIFSVNTYGVFFGMKHADQFVSPGGSIINTSSRAGTIGVPGNSQYSATKSAVDSLTRVAALEFGKKAIRVNAVCPSFFQTDMGGSDLGRDLAEALTPAGRLGQLSDLVGVYHFLASDESKYISGQTVNVDGGWSAGVSQQLYDSFIR